MSLSRPGPCSRSDGWLRSSARSHLEDRPDHLCERRPLRDRAPDWRAFLAEDPPAAMPEALRAGERTGRPLGDVRFIDRLEAALGRTIHTRKSGPRSAAKRKG